MEFPEVLLEGILNVTDLIAVAKAKQNTYAAYLRITKQNIAYANGMGTGTFEERQQPTDWMSEAQFIKYRCGFALPGGHLRKRSTPQQAFTPSPCTSLPATKDWTQQLFFWNQYSPVQDQKNCGCGYIFASVGNVEGQEAFLYGTFPKKLSEEQLLQCTVGCNPGDPRTIFTESINNGGLVLASNYTAYDGKDGQGCHETAPRHARSTVDHWATLPTDEASMKCAIANNGPITLPLYGSSADFRNFYGTGVFNDPNKLCGSAPNHAVLLMGYGTDPKYGDFWLVKSSWGTGWGNKGYAKIQRGTNLCGVTSFPMFPVLAPFCSGTVDEYLPDGTYYKTVCLKEETQTQSGANTRCAQYDMGLYNIEELGSQVTDWLIARGYNYNKYVSRVSTRSLTYKV